jgi:Domain of unknown function (DUF4333)
MLVVWPRFRGYKRGGRFRGSYVLAGRTKEPRFRQPVSNRVGDPIAHSTSTAPALLPRVLPLAAARKIRSRPLVFLLLTLVIGSVALAGCGTVVSREKLEFAVESSLEESIHEKIKKVECPSDESVDPGATFTCDVIFSDDRREVATLKIRNEEADISMVSLKPKK